VKKTNIGGPNRCALFRQCQTELPADHGALALSVCLFTTAGSEIRPYRSDLCRKGITGLCPGVLTPRNLSHWQRFRQIWTMAF
jgi:hypothetical protein